jgi:hypothetical protein
MHASSIKPSKCCLDGYVPSADALAPIANGSFDVTAQAASVVSATRHPFIYRDRTGEVYPSGLNSLSEKHRSKFMQAPTPGQPFMSCSF